MGIGLGIGLVLGLVGWWVIATVTSDDTTAPTTAPPTTEAPSTTVEDPYADWVEFADPDGRFIGSFPVPPERRAITGEGVAGAHWVGATSERQVSVAYADLANQIAPDMTDGVLDAAVARRAEAFGATIELVTPVDYQGFPGRAVRLRYGDGRISVSRFFTDSMTLWVVEAIGAEARDADLQHVLDSLVLL